MFFSIAPKVCETKNVSKSTSSGSLNGKGNILPMLNFDFFGRTEQMRLFYSAMFDNLF